MLDIHHFSYGWLTPLLAYVMSFTGSLLGLQCAMRARSGTSRPIWLTLSALSIGGAGIWVMHFIAMLGFSIQGAEVRYDVPLTLLSAVCAITLSGLGLFLVVRPRPSVAMVAGGGAVTGIGIAAMHYVGMAALRTDAAIEYQPLLVVLSVLIAIAAAGGALWFAVRVEGLLSTVGAAAIMALATSGMHYTGMASLEAQSGHRHGPPEGAGAMQLLVPLIVGISIVTMLLLITVSLTSIERAVDLPPLEPVQVRPAADDFATGPLPVVRAGQHARPSAVPESRAVTSSRPAAAPAAAAPPAGYRLPPAHRTPEPVAPAAPEPAPRRQEPNQSRPNRGKSAPQPVAAAQTSGTQYWPTTDDIRRRGKS
ncbi:MHYT domain-containing protein [Nocardia shimofusensis]|uniref:MHYT domain-containing protein n=1 Tax=Nocardia shimofusensis TaxID=228596 RepID=UPI00082EE767|nr:MHYT domain-containing protein [Nocardia shimofusensis]